MSKILVIPRTELTLPYSGFTSISPNMEKHLTGAGTFRERSEMEVDITYKQIIPYMVLEQSGKIFVYQRKCSNDSEARLASKISIGVGGHCDMTDYGDGPDPLIITALKRELREELNILPNIEGSTAQVLGIVNHDGPEDNGVHQVHLGLAFMVSIPSECRVLIRETDKLESCGFKTLPELAEMIASPDETKPMELWSRLLITPFLHDGFSWIGKSGNGFYTL